MSTNTKSIDIGLICVGSEICIPIENVNNKSTSSVTNVYVDVDIPNGLLYKSHSMGQGSYDSSTKRWTIGTMHPQQILQGQICFTVVEDCLEPYVFTFTVNSQDGCEDAECFEDNIWCVNANGWSCCELKKCDPDIARPNYFVIPQNDIDYPINVSSNDAECPAGTPTYEWIETQLIHGTISGTPDNAKYTPLQGFTGMGLALYGKYCEGNLVDKNIVALYVTAGVPTDDIFILEKDTVFEGNVSANDLTCINGGGTSYVLESNSDANGIGLSEPTSNANVTITEWNRLTGEFKVIPTNGYEGVATFEYRQVCTDPIEGRTWESDPVIVRLEIPVPFDCTHLNICSIDSISDVDTSTAAPTMGQVLKWDGSNWTPGDDLQSAFDCTSLNTCSIDDLSDVDTTTSAPGIGEVLTWNGTNWIPASGAGFECNDLVLCSVDSLSDVDTTTAAPNLNDVLQWDGSNWVPSASTNLGSADQSVTAATRQIIGDGTNVLDINTFDEVEISSATLARLVSDEGGANEAYVRVQNGQVYLKSQLGFYTLIVDPPVSGAEDTLLTLGGGGTLLKREVNTIPIGDLDEIDTTTTPPSIGQVLKWNGTNWIPDDDSAVAFDCSDLNTCSIDNLSDVDTTTSAPSTDDVLQWDGANWVPAALSSIGDDWGTQVVVSDGTLTGDGDGTPLGVDIDAVAPGIRAMAVTKITSNVTLNYSNSYVEADSTSSPILVTLPSTPVVGEVVIVKNINLTFGVTVTTPSGKILVTTKGAAGTNHAHSVTGQSFTYLWDGVNWSII